MTSDFFNLFSVSEESLHKLIQSALSKGGDYADLFFEYSTSDDLTLRDGEVNSCDISSDYGVGIRVIKDGHTGYAYAESTDPEQMKRAALTAAGIANSPDAVKLAPVNITELRYKNRYPILRNWEEFPIETRKQYLLEMDAAARGLSSEKATVVKVIANLSHDLSKVMFFNSLGEFYTDIRPMTSLVVSCILSKGTQSDSVTSSRSFMMGAELLSAQLREEMIGELRLRMSDIFEATQPKGGEMAVVMGPGSSGILLHEAIGHSFEADFNRKGTSIFSDRMGQKICASNINVVDDGTIAANRGAVNIDDEGVPGQKTYMVRKGVLTSYLHDRISAKHYGVAPTGNGRRESFRFNPIPRMRATYMEDGDATQQELIAGVKKGIFVDNFTNGEVEIGAGDFTFYVKSGYLIENGRLTAPIKDTNIIGNGPQALADIIGVASDSCIDNGTWTCGKDQYCNVSCGMPSVLVKSLTVGGEE